MANNVYQSEYTGQQMDSKFSAVATLQEAVSALETAVAAKYTKPDNGIPATDLDADVQNALALALTAVQSLADYYTKAQVDAIAAAIAAAVNSTSGVTVTTLPTASADTLGKIYYVGPDGNGEYARKVTSYDGTTYSWLDLGTTAIDLTQYATKAELSQLDREVNGVPASETELVATGTNTKSVLGQTGSEITASSDASVVATYAAGPGSYKISGRVGSTANTCLAAFFDENDEVLGFSTPTTGTATAYQDVAATAPTGTVKIKVAGNTTNNYAPKLVLVTAAVTGLKDEVDALADDVEDLQEEVAALDGLTDIGEVKASANMYNKADPDVVTGKYLSATDGTPKNGNANYMTSGYMPCTVGKTYCFSKGGEAANAYFICYYDSNKVYTGDSINGVNGDPFQTWTVPSGTLGTPAYFRISFRVSNAAVAQVEDGSVPTEYQAYGSAVMTYDYRTAIRAALNKREVIVLGDSSMYADYWPSLLKGLSGEIGMDFSVTICSESGASWNSAENSPLDQWNAVKSGVGDTPVIIIGAGGVSISSYQLGYDDTFARCFEDTSGMATGTDCAIETLKTILKDRPAARIFIQNNWMYEANDLAAARKRLKLAEMNRALCDYFGCVYVDVARGGNIHGYTEKLQVDGNYPYRVFTADGVHVSTEVGKRYIFNLWLGYFMLYLADYAIHTITLPEGS